MRRSLELVASALGVLTVTAGSAADAHEGSLTIRAKRLYVGDGRILVDRVVGVENGKITSINDDRGAPTDYAVNFLLPGFVDVHSHMCRSQYGGSPSEGAGPAYEHYDELDLGCPDRAIAASDGVTTIVTRPGSFADMSGSSLALKVKPGRLGDAIFREPADLKFSIKEEDDEAAAARIRNRLNTARDVIAGKLPQSADGTKIREVRALSGLFSGKLRVHIHCTGPVVVQLRCIAIAKDYGLRLTLAHATHEAVEAMDLEGHPDNVDLNVGPTIVANDGGEHFYNSAALAANRGYRTSLQVDASNGYGQGLLRAEMLQAIKYGLPASLALQTITFNSAAAADLGNVVGSIETGRDADFSFFERDPFDLRSPVAAVMIDGNFVFKNAELLSTTNEHVRLERPVSRLELPSSPISGSVLFRNVMLFAPEGWTVKDVLTKNGLVAQVAGKIAPESGVPSVELRGRYMTPGFISLASHAGLTTKIIIKNPDYTFTSLNSDPVTERSTPARDLAREIDKTSPSFANLRRIGVTTAMIVPGVSRLGGLTTIRSTAATGKPLGRAMAYASLGISPDFTGINSTESLMGLANELRSDLETTRAALSGKVAPRGYEEKVKLLADVLRGDRKLLIECRDQMSVLTALRIAAEFQIKPILLVSDVDDEGIDKLASSKTPVIYKVAFNGQRDPRDVAVKLLLSGVSISLMNFEGFRDGATLQFPFADPTIFAAQLVARGVPENVVLDALTREPSRILGLEDHIGEIKAGAQADLLIFAGPPLSGTSLLELELQGGKEVLRWKTDDFLRAPVNRVSSLGAE